MKAKLIVPAGIALAAISAVTFVNLRSDPNTAEGIYFLGQPVTNQQLVLGQDLYASNCASCHGDNLEGQADWKRRLENGRMRAPPHDETGHTWHHSDRNLFSVTKGGVAAAVPGYESDMPAFGDTLTDAEIKTVLAFIKSTWPEKQRNFQAKISANDKGDL